MRRRIGIAAMAVVLVVLTTTLVAPVANALCDPSHGLHPGLVGVCFLMWLMEVFGAEGPF